ncbi:MAG TPA: hypothetical protein VGO00_26020 [Kofleriaceae bacterium]|nr:hypothetical protein [Kofleriaceae bacterium]
MPRSTTSLPSTKAGCTAPTLASADAASWIRRRARTKPRTTANTSPSDEPVTTMIASPGGTVPVA